MLDKTPKKCAYYKCNTYFTPKQSKHRFCSYRCKNNNTLTKIRRTLKQRLVDYKGGKCERCGYDTCIDALEFHHKDPTNKDFQISSNVRSIPWEKLKAEVDKCVLLCANCHREEHCINNDFTISVNTKKELKKEPVKKEKIKNFCKNCGKECKNKFCSHLCADVFRRRVERPSKEELLLLLKNNSLVKISKM